MTIKLFSLAVSAGLFVATSASAAVVYPTTLYENTTGAADAIFLGAPDGTNGGHGTNFLGLGGQHVTYDFGVGGVVNIAGGDINVYEVAYGSPEFGSITVWASNDGLAFTNITSSGAGFVSIPTETFHNGANGNARSYDLGAFTSARYIRVDGNGTGAAGSTSGFDLDGIAAIQGPAISTVPVPASLLLLGTALAGLGLRRNKKHLSK
jgi:hypothetical protein